VANEKRDLWLDLILIVLGRQVDHNLFLCVSYDTFGDVHVCVFLSPMSFWIRCLAHVCVPALGFPK